MTQRCTANHLNPSNAVAKLNNRLPELPCGLVTYFQVCLDVDNVTDSFSSANYLPWAECGVAAPPGWMPNLKAAPREYDAGACAKCATSDQGDDRNWCELSRAFAPSGFDDWFGTCQNGKLTRAVTVARFAVCEYDDQLVGPAALAGSPEAATAACTVDPQQVSRTFAVGTACTVGGKCLGCEAPDTDLPCQHTIVDPQAGQTNGVVDITGECTAVCRCEATCFGQPSDCARSSTYATHPNPVFTLDSDNASNCSNLTYDLAYPATCTSSNLNMLTHEQAQSGSWCSAQTVRYSMHDPRDFDWMTWGSTTAPRPATCLHPTCSTCTTLDPNPALNVAMVPKELSLQAEDYHFRWENNSLCQCSMYQCKKHSSSTRFYYIQEECTISNELAAKSQWTPTKIKSVSAANEFGDFSPVYSTRCADYTQIRFTRDVFCSLAGRGTGYSGADCAALFGVRDLPISTLSCKDASFTCDPCTALGPGKGLGKPLTITKLGVSKDIPELVFGADILASKCACSAGVRNGAQVTSFAYDYGTYAPLPTCAGGTVTAEVTSAPVSLPSP